MDTSIYRYVTAIAECGSISAAAKKLFISQPALTKQLGRLESSLGFKLFDRGSIPISLTAEGEIFLEYAYQYLRLEQEMTKKLQQVGRWDGMDVQVATTHRGGTYVGLHTAMFLKEYPQVQVEYLDSSASSCEEALVNEQVELAVYTDPVISDKIEYMPLEEDPLVLVIPRSSSIFQGKNLEDNDLEHLYELEPEELNREDLVFIRSTSNHSLYLAENALFKQYKVRPARTFTVDYVDTRYNIACGGGGVALLPFVTIDKRADHRNVVYATLKGEQLYRYVIIARKKGRAISQGARLFWKFMIGQRFQDTI
ncbi:MAG: LysR family transcriptional regulator [Lachnospiraceae bacterium]|uniref:LysR family transcriptional regulator n=1 Tax=Candidatus Enterocloster excrementigallinarum TaxID=2838558 RepID=A0A9D2TDP0_9FIRM|nr:LysR family transcriptional regulator [Lachnospiraceae bacterium]HJC65321.1 LysR family transcriptional regulator [Candidatus Enterocloster excrementigallinarum]